MRADLASVNRSRTPWLVVGGHRPFYIDSTSVGKPDSDQTVAEDLRTAFEDLFLQHAVDLTLHGHHHSYQRSCPVFEGSCQEDLEGARSFSRPWSSMSWAHVSPPDTSCGWLACSPTIVAAWLSHACKNGYHK